MAWVVREEGPRIELLKNQFPCVENALAAAGKARIAAPRRSIFQAIFSMRVHFHTALRGVRSRRFAMWAGPVGLNARMVAKRRAGTFSWRSPARGPK
jgi:hypothetical protein